LISFPMKMFKLFFSIYLDHASYEDITTLLEIEEELDDLEQLTIIQLGDSSSPGDIPLIQEQPEGRDKDKEKKKSKSKLKSGKQTKSTVKAPVSAKKASTNTAPSSKKKILQGLLILRPSLGGTKGILTARDRDRDRNEESDTGRKGNREKGSDRDSNDSDMPVRLPTLIVGRSSKQNDRITFEIAKEHHLWFHVQVSRSHHLSRLAPHNTTHFNRIALSHPVCASDSTQVSLPHSRLCPLFSSLAGRSWVPCTAAARAGRPALPGGDTVCR
jgi:hypothetical protein